MRPGRARVGAVIENSVPYEPHRTAPGLDGSAMSASVRATGRTSSTPGWRSRSAQQLPPDFIDVRSHLRPHETTPNFSALSAVCPSKLDAVAIGCFSTFRAENTVFVDRFTTGFRPNSQPLCQSTPRHTRRIHSSVAIIQCPRLFGASSPLRNLRLHLYFGV